MVLPTLFAVIGILMMLCSGFIGGFYTFAKETGRGYGHPYIAIKKNIYKGRVLQYTLILSSIYLIVTYSDITLAFLTYLYAEYGLPRVAHKRYEKIFEKYGSDAAGVQEPESADSDPK